MIGAFLSSLGQLLIGGFRSLPFRLEIIPSVVRNTRVGIALFDRGHPSFWNFHPAIAVYVLRVKSCVNSLFNPACVPMWVSIHKLNFAPERIVPDRTSVL